MSAKQTNKHLKQWNIIEPTLTQIAMSQNSKLLSGLSYDTNTLHVKLWFGRKNTI